MMIMRCQLRTAKGRNAAYAGANGSRERAAVRVQLVQTKAGCEEDDDDEKKRSRLASRWFGRRESIT